MLRMNQYQSMSAKYFQRIILIVFFFSIFLLICSENTSAQAKATDHIITSRPTVGLVLSGGGARGIAHLGVIRVMEEAGLRPDYITGVSMGSIIGGMYALGYTTDSLQKILENLKWKLVLSNNIPENKVIYLEKEHFNNSIVSLPLTSKKVMLPSGIISGQQFENTLSFYTWPAADINDFSKLPIPFMCIGTDIITYKKVELKTGYLADAIRASSSVPSMFTPLKIDTLLLLDGGLVRNFAAKEVRDMGADIVIGSYVGFYAYDEDKLKSVSAIMEQIAMSRSLTDFNEQKNLVDLLIKPGIEKYSLFDFENVDSIVQKGYKAALPYKEYFRKLADSLNSFGVQKPIDNILEKQTYTFQKIEVKGNKWYSDFQILGVLGIKPGEAVDKHLLSDRIELLYGKTWFDKVKYRVVPRNDSLILVIDCIEKPKAMLYGSGFYNNSLQAGLMVGLSVKDLLTPNSAMNLKTYIGQYSRLNFNSLQFIDRNQKYALSMNFYAENTLLPMIKLRGSNSDIISRNYIPGASVIRVLGLNQMMSISANFEILNLMPRYNSNLPLRNISYNYISAVYDYKLNSVDTKHFPNKGTILNISVNESKLASASIKDKWSETFFKESKPGEFSFRPVYALYGNILHYFSPPGKFTFSIGGDALFISESDSVTSNNNFYLLGGIESLNNRSIPMVGFQSNEIPVKKMAGIRSEIDIEVLEDFHLDFMANFFAAQEVYRQTGFSVLSGYGIGIGYMSIIGPLRIGIMHGNYAQEEFFRETKGYISFGYKF
jgi:NTE family protein